MTQVAAVWFTLSGRGELDGLSRVDTVQHSQKCFRAQGRKSIQSLRVILPLQNVQTHHLNVCILWHNYLFFLHKKKNVNNCGHHNHYIMILYRLYSSQMYKLNIQTPAGVQFRSLSLNKNTPLDVVN